MCSIKRLSQDVAWARVKALEAHWKGKTALARLNQLVTPGLSRGPEAMGYGGCCDGRNVKHPFLERDRIPAQGRDDILWVRHGERGK